MMCSWHPWIYSTPFRWTPTFSWPLVSLRPARNMSLGRWLLVACFSSVKNHNVSGPRLLPNVTTHAQKSLCFPRTVLHEQKNHFAIGRNSERCHYHTDLSRFVLSICDPSAVNFSQFVGCQDSPNLSKIEKVAETCEFDGKEPLFVERAIEISNRVLGWTCLIRVFQYHCEKETKRRIKKSIARLVWQMHVSYASATDLSRSHI